MATPLNVTASPLLLLECNGWLQFYIAQLLLAPNRSGKIQAVLKLPGGRALLGGIHADCCCILTSSNMEGAEKNAP